jgi:hypothetical protein
LRNVIFHVFLDTIIHLGQAFVPETVVPLNDFDSFSRFGVFLNPFRNLLVVCAGRHEILELVRSSAGEFKKHSVHRTVKVVFAERVIECRSTFVECSHPDDVASQQFPWTAWIIFG